MDAEALVRQQAFDQPLAVVEIAPHGEIQDVVGASTVVIWRRWTGETRSCGWSTIRSNPVGVAEGGDGGGAGIAAGRRDQRQPLARGGQSL